MCGLVSEMCCFLGEITFFFLNDAPKKYKVQFIREFFIYNLLKSLNIMLNFIYIPKIFSVL